MIFDLWDTLVDLWTPEDSAALRVRMAKRSGVEPDSFHAVWFDTYLQRELAPLVDDMRMVLAKLGADIEHAEALCDMRREFTRFTLVPRRGAIETLEELGRRGLKRGLVSVSSGEVAEIWEETELASHLDAVVLSCVVGVRKPDPRIYSFACEALGVAPEECLYVGDGAGDELASAANAGMRPVLILRPAQEEPYWEEAHGWQPRITSLEQVLELV